MITEADAKQFYSAIRFGAAKADVPERDVFCMFLAVVWESIITPAIKDFQIA